MPFGVADERKGVKSPGRDPGGVETFRPEVQRFFLVGICLAEMGSCPSSDGKAERSTQIERREASYSKPRFGLGIVWPPDEQRDACRCTVQTLAICAKTELSGKVAGLG